MALDVLLDPSLIDLLNEKEGGITVGKEGRPSPIITTGVDWTARGVDGSHLEQGTLLYGCPWPLLFARNLLC